MSREKDAFNIIYAGDCQETFDDAFFTNHTSFKCWTASHSENSLYLAILPLFESEDGERKKVLDKIIGRYRPVCNLDIKESKPEYKIRPKQDLPNTSHISCPCCGSNMEVEKILENSTLIRCIQCGLSDTRLNS